VVEQLGLHRRGQDGTAGDEVAERRQVPGTGPQLVGQRPGEGVADDEQRRGLVALAGVEQVDRVEPAGVLLEDDGAAGQPGAEGVPVGGAVHERRGRQCPERLAVG
jgi:hypothetical protein